MNLVMAMVLVSLFAQCGAYQLPTVHRIGLFAIQHHPRWLTRLPVNNSLRHSYSSWSRLFSIADKKEGGKDLAFPSLDLDRKNNIVENKRHSAAAAASYVEDEMARAGLPEEIKNNQYASEKELHMDLEQFRLDDLSIILDPDGFPMWLEMTSEVHVGAVSKIIYQFDKWKKGRLILGRTEVNLEQLGLDDRRIILDPDGFPMWREMTSEAHVGAVSMIIDQFDTWDTG